MSRLDYFFGGSYQEGIKHKPESSLSLEILESESYTLYNKSESRENRKGVQ